MTTGSPAIATASLILTAAMAFLGCSSSGDLSNCPEYWRFGRYTLKPGTEFQTVVPLILMGDIEENEPIAAIVMRDQIEDVKPGQYERYPWNPEDWRQNREHYARYREYLGVLPEGTRFRVTRIEHWSRPKVGEAIDHYVELLNGDYAGKEVQVVGLSIAGRNEILVASDTIGGLR